MQPDPIGYGDGLNMYAYVGGDPVNGRYGGEGGKVRRSSHCMDGAGTPLRC